MTLRKKNSNEEPENLTSVLLQMSASVGNVEELLIESLDAPWNRAIEHTKVAGRPGEGGKSQPAFPETNIQGPNSSTPLWSAFARPNIFRQQ